MPKRFRFLRVGISLLLVVIALAQPVMAGGGFDEQEGPEEEEIIASFSLPNYVTMELIKIDNNNVRVSVSNIGIDSVDSFVGTVVVINTLGVSWFNQQIMLTNIPPMGVAYRGIYVTNWSRITVVDITITDGSDVIYDPGPYIKYSN
jgi:hypothetical protein